MGIIFVTILLFETLYGRIKLFQVQHRRRGSRVSPAAAGAAPRCCGACHRMTDLGNWSIPLAVFGGAIRVGTPYLYVSLGECLTEKSGRVNLGLEGTLVMGAMAGYAISYETGSPWIGVLAAGGVGALFGALHALICNRPRVNSVAVGIAMMVFGIGLAAYLGKPYIQPSAPQLPSFNLGRLVVDSASSVGVANQRAVHHRVAARAGDGLDAEEHAVGHGRPPGRREHGRCDRDGLFDQSHAADCHDRRRSLRRRRRKLSLALLSRRMDRTDLLGARADGRCTGDLRPLEADQLPLGVAACSAASGSIGVALQGVGLATSAAATTYGTRHPTFSRCSSWSSPAREPALWRALRPNWEW